MVGPSAKKHALAKDPKFGLRLRRIREARGLSQKQVADAFGVSYQTISFYENGVNVPAGSRLVDLAQALGVSIKDLYKDKPVTAIDPQMLKDTKEFQEAWGRLTSQPLKLAITTMIRRIVDDQKAKEDGQTDVAIKAGERGLKPG